MYFIKRIGKISYTDKCYDIDNLKLVVSDGAWQHLKDNGYCLEVLKNGDVLEIKEG